MSDMTREEAIDEIKRWTPILLNSGQCTEKTSEAQDMAISALSAIEKIRAEIAEIEGGISSYYHDRPWIFKDEALAVIDKHIGGKGK